MNINEVVELKINRVIKEFIDQNKNRLFDALNVHEGYSSLNLIEQVKTSIIQIDFSNFKCGILITNLVMS